MTKHLTLQTKGSIKIKCSILFGKKIFSAIIFVLFLSISITTYAQQTAQDESCGIMEYTNAAKLLDPLLESKMLNYEQQIQQWIADNPDNEDRAVVTIPVVFHIVYKNSSENISNTKCLEVLQALNEDFGRTNPDAHLTPGVWTSIAANTGIQFCMAKRTPTGASTNGIERRQTSVQQFYYTNNKIKFFSTGGLNAWNVKKYLNIWIGDIDVSYGEFPTSTASNTFGLVCRYAFLGLGTWVATHEIGHCFNLRHIWGDDGGSCGGSDFVSDTPNQANKTSSCPGPFPQTDGCSPNNPGIMFMNYMDYTPGYCSGSCTNCDSRNLFTKGQKTRMNAVLNVLPYSALKTSNGCSPVIPPTPPVPTLSTNTCGPKTLTRATPPSGTIYYWQGTSCGTSTSLGSASNYTVNTSGTYYLRAKYSNGTWSNCSSKAVVVNPIPANPAAPTVSLNLCGSKTLTTGVPPSGVTFYWQGTGCGTSTGSSGSTYSASVSGTYKIRARSSAGCWSSCSSVGVTINPNPTPSVSGQNSVCSNTNGVLYSVLNSGNIFSWSISGGTIASGQNTNSVFVNWGTAGIGIATVTETNPSTNCSKTVSMNVNINSSLNPSITSNGPTNICQGDSVMLDASAGFASYLWSNGATTQTITIFNTETFSVSVAGNNGCSGSSTTPVTVTVSPNPSITISPAGVTSFCEGDSVFLTSTSAGISTYTWTNGETTQNILVSDSGSYSVTVTDTNGCSTTSAVAVIIVNPLQPTPAIIQNNDTLSSSAASGNQWYLNGFIITGATSQYYAVTENGSYSVIVTDTLFGCFAASDLINVENVSIETIFNDPSLLSIFPNPVTNVLNISYSNPNSKSLTIKLIDITGQLIYQEDLHPFRGDYNKEIDMHNVASGIYFIKIIADTNVIIQKVVKE